MLSVRRVFSVVASVGLLCAFTGCTSSQPPPATSVAAVATIRETTLAGTVARTDAPPTEITTIATTVPPTTLEPATTTTPVPTLPAKPGAPATVFSTPLVMEAPGLNNYPTVTGDYTDQDFARIVAGRYREYWTQAETMKPNLERLRIWESEQRSAESFKELSQATKDHIQHRPGSIDDFVVTNVDRAGQLVLVTFCSRQNAARWDLGKTSAPDDDKLLDDSLGVLNAQFALVRDTTGVWHVDGILDLGEGTCAKVLG
jgi:hypothetical protein